MVLSRSQPESNSTFNWNKGVHLGILTSTTRFALSERSISSSFVRFPSQMRESLPLKLFSENRRLLSDSGRFEDGFIGISPLKKFLERSNSSIRGSENKNVGMFPLNWLELKYNSRRFLRISNAAEV